MRANLLVALAETRAALRRTSATHSRMLARIARDDKRAWVVRRRERTRQLIELGGLVAKSGLVELTEDDRAAIFGLMVEAASMHRGEDREAALTLWRRGGKRAFEDSGGD